ncbi:hypothetical protein ABID99_003592 [Mucilaginibacter sp. OAE612]|uniref:hypothetical protein n=1 Tax=Mucilaginibacter sp. OAE612 TaxID=3156444 RepID=UPI00359E1104
MARETILKYNEKGIWIDQDFVQVLSYFICKAFEIKGLDTFPPNLKGIYDDCYYNRNGESAGMVNILFDDSITGLAEKDALFEIFQDARSLVSAYGEAISVNILNQFEDLKTYPEFKSLWTIPIKTQSLITTLNIIEQMIDGTLQPSLTSIYYSGFNNPDGVPEV